MGVLWPGICLLAVVIVALVCLIVLVVWLVRRWLGRGGPEVSE